MADTLYHFETEIKSDVQTAFRWHEREGALLRLTPPWEKIDLIEKTGGIETGAKCTINVHAGFITIPWQAEHIGYVRDRHFKDRQNKGPFAKWEHTHDFEATPSGTVIKDTVEYRLPFHPFSTLIAGKFMKNKLDRMFRYRSSVSKNDIEILSQYKPAPKTIVISGASGAVGSSLIPYLQTQGHRIIRLIRNKKQLCIGDVCWNPHMDIIEDSFENADVVIHLAGEPIGNERWSESKKLSIIESRVKSTSLLAKTLAEMKNPPKLFICASAIGLYGNRGEEELDEDSTAGRDFISQVCSSWEAAAKPAEERGIRTVYLRIGVALSPKGGALQRMMPPTAFGLGAVAGSGRQFLSWVSMDDVLYAVTHIMETDGICGAVNLTSPNPVRWTQFADEIASAMNRPRFLKIPESVIRMVYGQMGGEVLLSGAKVMPKKLLESGFTFRYPLLSDTLKHLLGRD
jgi:uncharacterized protein (TIGR01777 family)